MPKPEKPRRRTTRAGGDRCVTITLTDSQIMRVLTTADDGEDAGSLVPLAWIGQGAWQKRVRRLERANDPGMSQSLLRGLLVLACFCDGSWLKIRDVSNAVGASMSTTHRYVTTLMAAGVLEQDPHKRLYRLVERA